VPLLFAMTLGVMARNYMYARTQRDSRCYAERYSQSRLEKGIDRAREEALLLLLDGETLWRPLTLEWNHQHRRPRHQQQQNQQQQQP
jgi:hypothetical protein